VQNDHQNGGKQLMTFLCSLLLDEILWFVLNQNRGEPRAAHPRFAPIIRDIKAVIHSRSGMVFSYLTDTSLCTYSI